MDSHDKEEERHREYRKGVKERPVTDKVDGRKMRVSEPAGPKAERTAQPKRSAGSIEKKNLTQEKPAHRSKRLTLVLALMLLGVPVAILVGRYAPADFVEQEQDLKPAKREIIRVPLLPNNEPSKVETRNPETTIPKKPREGFTEKQETKTKTPTPQTFVQSGEKRPPVEVIQQERLVSYPYSLHLGSFKNMERARRAIVRFQKKGISPYWVKIDLGPKGVWYRVFAHYFQSRQEAEAFAKKNHITKGTTRHTRYANLISLYDSEDDIKRMRLKLLDLGYSPYVIKGTNGKSYLFTGAFYYKRRAEKQQRELASKGIQSQMVER
jgi:cell division septation protein DedD